MMDFFKQCEDAILNGDRDRAVRLATDALENRYPVLDIIENGFSPGIRRAGELWEMGEYFLPELAFSAESMKAAMDVLQPALLDDEAEKHSKGVVIIGTVQGDIHDIGKTLVATLLAANGYRVVDLGADVAYDRFVEEARTHHPALVCMSALLTTTMVGQKTVIDKLTDEGLRDKVKILVGGAPASAAWAGSIGADAYAENAVEAVKKAKALLS